MSRLFSRLLSLLRVRRDSRGGSLTTGQEQVLRANLRSLLFTKDTLSET